MHFLPQLHRGNITICYSKETFVTDSATEFRQLSFCGNHAHIWVHSKRKEQQEGGPNLAKGITSTTRGNPPATAIIRIRPEEITHGTLMWHLLHSVQVTNVVKRINAWGQPSMQTKNLWLHLNKDSSNWSSQLFTYSEKLQHIVLFPFSCTSVLLYTICIIFRARIGVRMTSTPDFTT
jgi:hypothetical protein